MDDLFDRREAFNLAYPRVFIAGRGPVEPERGEVNLVIPLLKYGNLQMTVEPRRRNEADSAIVVPWRPGSLCWISTKADLQVRGDKTGHLVFFRFSFGPDDPEEVKSAESEFREKGGESQ